jgi:hypothetical protein
MEEKEQNVVIQFDNLENLNDEVCNLDKEIRSFSAIFASMMMIVVILKQI